MMDRQKITLANGRIIEMLLPPVDPALESAALGWVVSLVDDFGAGVMPFPVACEVDRELAFVAAANILTRDGADNPAPMRLVSKPIMPSDNFSVEGMKFAISKMNAAMREKAERSGIKVHKWDGRS